jgi:hypothetical protein
VHVRLLFLGQTVGATPNSKAQAAHLVGYRRFFSTTRTAHAQELADEYIVVGKPRGKKPRRRVLDAIITDGG